MELLSREFISDDQIKVGDLIVTRLLITAKNKMEFVHLKDSRPAGLEPINVLSEYKWMALIFIKVQEMPPHIFSLIPYPRVHL